jgi:hypothetical protein
MPYVTTHNLQSSKRSGGPKANQSDMTALDASAYLPVMSTTVWIRKGMPGREEDFKGLFARLTVDFKAVFGVSFPR